MEVLILLLLFFFNYMNRNILTLVSKVVKLKCIHQLYGHISQSVIFKISMWAYYLMVNKIVRSKYIFVENDKIEILFSNYIFGLTFEYYI